MQHPCQLRQVVKFAWVHCGFREVTGLVCDLLPHLDCFGIHSKVMQLDLESIRRLKRHVGRRSALNPKLKLFKSLGIWIPRVPSEPEVEEEVSVIERSAR